MPPERFIDLKKAAKAREQRQATHVRKQALFQDVHAGRHAVSDVVGKIAAEHDKDKKDIATQVYAGASALITRRAPTLYNAVIHHEAKKLAAEDGGNSDGRETLPNLSHHIAQIDWRNLPEEKQKALMDELEQDRREKEAEQSHMVSAGVITRDFNRTLAKLEPELISLGQRTGSEYLVLFLKGKTRSPYETHVVSSPKVTEACGSLFAQTPEELALKIENFCTSGLAGTIQNLEHRNREDSQGSIRDIITKGLHEVLSQKGMPEELWPKYMQYVHYDKLVVELGVELVGWPEAKVGPITDINSSFRLSRMLKALRDRECRWEILSNEDWKARKLAYKEKVESGQVKPRATRKDKGTRRKGKDRSQRGKKGPKSRAIISDSDVSSSSSDGHDTE